MNLPRYIAARMARTHAKASWSRPVVRIATAGVSLGIALIILASAVVEGFQHEVKELVVGFGAHVQVLSTDPTARSIQMDASLQQRLSKVEGVRRVQPFFTLPGLLETREDHEGVVVKGIGQGLDFRLLEESIVKGRVDIVGDSIVISGPQARELKLDVGDAVRLYLVADDGPPRPRRMGVAGVYETGLFEFDREFVFAPLEAIQQAAGWGLEAQGAFEADGFLASGFGVESGRWSWLSPDTLWNEVVQTWHGPGPHALPDFKPAPVAAVFTERNEPFRKASDTVWFTPVDSGWIAASVGGGSRFHASGYEVYLDGFKDLWKQDEAIYDVLPLGWTTQTIIEQSPEMFSWLGMLDLNVEIIIGLMVLISIINMASALLIIILERTAMVGLLKAIGLSDGAVVEVFVWHAVRILGKGFLWGNLLGLGLAWVQIATGWIGLDPAAYYIDTVPMRLNASRLLLIQGSAFLVCAVMMVFPAWVSARIQPSAALRFS